MKIAQGRGFWVLLATILASSMAFIDSTALGVAMPRIQTDMQMSGAQPFWVTNAYLLFLAALILVGGSLGDRYGRKRIFMLGIIIFSGASLACGLAPTVDILIIARAVKGIGGALMVPGSLAILSASFPAESRGAAIGLWSTASTLTTLGGPVLGGWLAAQGLWRWVFFINLPLALVSLVALWTRVDESHDEAAPRQLDWLGAGLVTIGLAGVTYGFMEAPTYGYGDPRIFLLLGLGILALIVFVVVELRLPNPMVPPGLFASRAFSGTNLLTFFLYGALGVFSTFLPFNLAQIQRYPEDVIGLVMLPLSLLLALLSTWAGGLSARIGPRPLLTLGPALAGAGFFLFALPGVTQGPNDYWTTFFPGVVLLGIGMGLTVAPLTTTVMSSAPAHSSGVASAINNAVARTASVLAIAILTALALTTFSSGLEQRTVALNLTTEEQALVRAEAPKLAAAEVPSGLPDALVPDVQAALDWAFVDSFRLLAIITAALAWISALIAYFTLRPQRTASSAA